MIEVRSNITKEFIFERVSQEEIFERYMGIRPDLTITYVNPLRSDPSPGCRFYYNDKGVLRFNDFSQKWNIDCFALVMHIESCSFGQALKKIAEDFTIDKKEVRYDLPTPNNSAATIEYSSDIWKKKHIDFWKPILLYGDSNNDVIRVLEHFKVKPIKAFWINNIRYNISNRENAFVYLIGNKLKIYLPNRSYNRFYQNGGTLTQGWEQLPESGLFALITKSYKDVISLYTFDVPCIAPASENTFISNEQWDSFDSRFTNKFLLYDNDYPGKKNMVRRLKEHNSLIPLLFSKDYEKDWTDNLIKYGPQEMLDILETIKAEML